jgi:hypothetical protein
VGRWGGGAVGRCAHHTKSINTNNTNLPASVRDATQYPRILRTLESRGAVHVLERRGIVIHHSECMLGVAEELVVDAWMLHVVNRT